MNNYTYNNLACLLLNAAVE